jgi:hypothetical protein
VPGLNANAYAPLSSSRDARAPGAGGPPTIGSRPVSPTADSAASEVDEEIVMDNSSIGVGLGLPADLWTVSSEQAQPLDEDISSGSESSVPEGARQRSPAALPAEQVRARTRALRERNSIRASTYGLGAGEETVRRSEPEVSLAPRPRATEPAAAVKVL